MVVKSKDRSSDLHHLLSTNLGMLPRPSALVFPVVGGLLRE